MGPSKPNNYDWHRHAGTGPLHSPVEAQAYHRSLGDAAVLSGRAIDGRPLGEFSNEDAGEREEALDEGVLDLEHSPTVSLVVETGCTFFSPICFPDRVHCGLRVASLGTTSVRYEIGVFRNHEALTAARGHFVHVCCDRRTHAPVAMPAGLRAALERLRVEPA